MNEDVLVALFEEIRSGRIAISEAVARLRHLPYEMLEYARVDHHRALRCGFPEVIFGLGKTPEQIENIFARIAAAGVNVLATRVSTEAANRVRKAFPRAEYSAVARTLALWQQEPAARDGFIAIVCAGTSDLPVAEEARITVEMMGQTARCFYDVGVAGLHRLLAETATLREAKALVVVAGMEGALPSVVGGLVEAPIIAVPTSVGYGASLGGVAALLAMLNSCAAGVSVVNIDNGFGAGYQAAMIGRIADRGAKRFSDEGAT